jgi:hypothetical protein
VTDPADAPTLEVAIAELFRRRAQETVRDIANGILRRLGTVHLLNAEHQEEIHRHVTVALLDGCATGREQQKKRDRERDKRRRERWPKVITHAAPPGEDPTFGAEDTTEPMKTRLMTRPVDLGDE